MRKAFAASLIFLVILLFPLNADAETLAYEGWVANGKHFFLDNSAYKVSVTDRGTSILLRYEEATEAVSRGDCLLKDYQKICYNSSVLDKEAQDYSAYIYVYYLKPVLKMTRKIDDNILAMGDTATFTVTIENTGDTAAKEITFREDLPQNIAIIDARDLLVEDNSIIWKGEIEKGEDITFTYKIKAQGDVDKYLKASLKYFDGASEKEIYSESIRLFAESVLNMELKTGKEEYQLNEEFELTLTLKNKGEDDLEILGIDIFLPDSTDVKSYKGATKVSEKRYRIKEDIDASESLEASFVLLPRKAGVSFIIIEGMYKYDGEQYETGNQKKGILISNEGIEITTSLSSAEYTNSNQLLSIFVRVKNKNSFTEIKNIEVETKTDITSIQKSSYGTIGINQTVIVLNTEILVPQEQSEKRYPIYFNITYVTEDGSSYSEKIERTIIVRPSKTAEIVPSISSYNVLEGETITVSVKIKNPDVTDIKDIFLKTEIPLGMSAKGATAGYLSADKGKESKTISFTLTPGIVEKEEKFLLNFTAAYFTDGKEYTLFSQKSINVRPKVPKVSMQKALSGTSAYLGELIDVSYVISNEDSSPIYDIVIKTTESQDFDTLNIFEKRIEKLNPGEKITVKAEQIRPKKKGKISAGRSAVFFKDNRGREFNSTSGEAKIDVKEAEISGPCVYLELIVPEEAIYENTSALVYINISGRGAEKAEGILKSSGERFTIPFDKSVLIAKNLSLSEKGTYALPAESFTYSYLNNEVRAYSNAASIKVIGINSPPEKNHQEAMPAQDGQLESSGQTQEKKNIFSVLADFIRKLFKKS